MGDEDQRKHLELIQGVITRLAGNSFSIKGWAVGLIAVLGSFAVKDADPRFAFGLWLPVLCFWGLDAFYLRQERLFRELYNAVVAGGATPPAVYSMDTTPYEKQVGSTLNVAFSKTVLWLHIPILIFVLALSGYSLHRMHAVHPDKSTTTSVKISDSAQPATAPAASPTPSKLPGKNK